MNDQPIQADVDAIHEELVAYLDGELDPTTALRVERRLADDVTYRERLHQLERAWDMLDQLPRSQVDESFTHNTMKLVQVKAEEDAKDVKVTAIRWRLLAWLAGAAGAAAAACLGFFLVTDYFSRPNDQLVQDLPVIENVDLYRHADSVEFLKSLEREGLFGQEVEDAL